MENTHRERQCNQSVCFSNALNSVNSYLCTRPQNEKELYNLRHASLRNAVERLFGVWKKRFRILKGFDALTYPFSTQVQLVLALAALHNFIRRTDPGDLFDEDEFEDADEAEDRFTIYAPPIFEGSEGVHRRSRVCENWRNGIAHAMWVDRRR